jgi:uncharacterized protein (DUF1330 family)
MVHMPACVIGQHIITDSVKLEEYKAKAEPMNAKYGGRYLTKGSIHQILEGGHWKQERVVIIEFPHIDAVNAWYSLAEYQPLIDLRRGPALAFLTKERRTVLLGRAAVILHEMNCSTNMPCKGELSWTTCALVEGSESSGRE